MPRNGSGTFSLVNNSWNPAVNGVGATAADWQNLANDIAAALTGSLAADGQTALIGNLNMGNNRVTNLAAGIALTDAAQIQQIQSGLAGQTLNGRMYLPIDAVSGTYTADEVIVEVALAAQTYRLATFNQTINVSITGAGGMDTGSAPANGWIAIYAIYNPTTFTRALLATNTTSILAPAIYGGANMPAGYSASGLLTVLRTSAGGAIIASFVSNRNVYINGRQVLSTTGLNPSLTVLTVASAAPMNAVSLGVSWILSSSAATTFSFQLAGSAAGLGGQSATGSDTHQIGSGTMNIPLVTRQQIYYLTSAGAGATNANIAVSSYEI